MSPADQLRSEIDALERQAESHEDDYRTDREPKHLYRMNGALVEAALKTAELKRIMMTSTGDV